MNTNSSPLLQPTINQFARNYLLRAFPPLPSPVSPTKDLSENRKISSKDEINISDDARNKQLEKLKKEGASKDLYQFTNPQELVSKWVESLTGSKISDVSLQNIDSQTLESSFSSTSATQAYKIQQSQTPAGPGQVYESSTITHEETIAHFQATGIVRTQDGQELSFKLEIQYTHILHIEEHRSFHASNNPSSDPLILNFNGNAEDLQNSKFNFEQNEDEQQNKLNRISGSGSLSFYKKQIKETQDFSNFFKLENEPELSKLQIWIQSFLDQTRESSTVDPSLSYLDPKSEIHEKSDEPEQSNASEKLIEAKDSNQDQKASSAITDNLY